MQSLYASGAITSIKGVLPILFGNNIGTTITAVIAALGGSIASKGQPHSMFYLIFWGNIIYDFTNTIY